MREFLLADFQKLVDYFAMRAVRKMVLIPEPQAVALDVHLPVLAEVVQRIEVSSPVTFLLQVIAIYSQGILHGI
ncbi:hypothetical protein N8Z26_07805 [Burkholderiales bacterium]|nr:hypothetical protein [Burkholderiales bacterium]